jgi:hypothetical protein
MIRVEFEVLEEIRSQGVLIVPKGGVALGTVTEAQPKRRMARGGKLEIVMDSVRLEDGEKAALRATKGGNGGGHTGAMTAGIVATALVCIVCAPLFLLMHGKDITIPKGTEIPTFVNGNMPLDLAKFQQGAAATQLAQADRPISDALPNSMSQTSNEAQLEVTSTPSGADVELDGSFVGNIPSSVGVPAGDHTVSVKKSGFKPWERKIKVSSGKVNVSAELESEVSPASAAVAATATPASPGESLGALSFTSDPIGAEVYVDNSLVGKTPVTSKLKPGQHYVRMFMAAYKNWSQQITAVGGSELKLAAKLEKSQ